jgi:hypothetical protein
MPIAQIAQIIKTVFQCLCLAEAKTAMSVPIMSRNRAHTQYWR